MKAELPTRGIAPFLHAKSPYGNKRTLTYLLDPVRLGRHKLTPILEICGSKKFIEGFSSLQFSCSPFGRDILRLAVNWSHVDWRSLYPKGFGSEASNYSCKPGFDSAVESWFIPGSGNKGFNLGFIYPRRTTPGTKWMTMKASTTKGGVEMLVFPIDLYSEETVARSNILPYISPEGDF